LLLSQIENFRITERLSAVFPLLLDPHGYNINGAFEDCRMGKNKHTRQRLTGDERRIRGHEEKIRNERAKTNPDEGQIRHWEAEIRGWKKQRERLLRRLPQQER
jgi:hypothetical protein